MQAREYMSKVLDHCTPQDRVFYNTIRAVEASIEAILALPDLDDAVKDKTIQAVIGGVIQINIPELSESNESPSTQVGTSSDPPNLIDELDAKLDQKFGQWVLSSSDDE
jgi:hypothetical protein